MYPVPGHLAYAVLGKRYFNIDWIPVIAGAMLPDLIDKPLDDIFHITPYGRYMMHSLLGMAVCVSLRIISLAGGSRFPILSAIWGI